MRESELLPLYFYCFSRGKAVGKRPDKRYKEEIRLWEAKRIREKIKFKLNQRKNQYFTYLRMVIN